MTDSALKDSAPIDGGQRKWFVMAAVATGTFLGTIDGSIVNIALPVLEKEFVTQFSVVQWVVLSYMLTVATLMLAVGRLADIFGKKGLYLAGFSIFTIGSGLCGLANTAPQLIAFRVIQAIGAAMITALGTAILTEAFPPQERGKALGIGGTMVSIGLISGPTLGGLILGALSWHWIFFVNLPVGLAGILLVIRYVPRTPAAGRERFEFPGAASLFTGMLAFLLALTLGQDRGFGSPVVLALMGLSLGAFFLFYWIETHTPQPIIDLSLFSNRLFSINLVTGFITFICIAGMVLLMPFFLQNVLHFQPRAAGLLLSVFPLSMGIVAPLAGSLSDRFGTRRLTAVGLGVLLLGYLSVSTLSSETEAPGYILRFLLIGLGMGFFQSPNNSAIMGNAPPGRLGVASGLLALTRTVGQTTGIALIGAVWASRVNVLLGGSGDTTAAPAAVQVEALQVTVWVIVTLVGVALGLSLWALWKESAQARIKKGLPGGV
jgi:EmrB/QacA subfamily drug resistance transporter